MLFTEIQIRRDNRENSDYFSYFSLKHVVNLHMNHLNETVPMKGHNIWFYNTEKYR